MEIRMENTIAQIHPLTEKPGSSESTNNTIAALMIIY